jgi:hypothetical protein
MRKISVSLLVLVLAGCSSSDVPLGAVSGRVTLDDKPLPDALVRFIPEPGGRSSQGMTDADGRYTLDYSSRSEGALVGKAKVMITTGSLEDRVRRTNERVPKRYNDETELTADVKRGSNHLDFKLSSK